jgi:hypothetical protein
MIVRHQRPSKSGRGFRKLARYIRGQSGDPRATWFLAANLPGVATAHDVELACHLVEAVQAQNTRAGKDRTYHLVISLHPEALQRGPGPRSRAASDAPTDKDTSAR